MPITGAMWEPAAAPVEPSDTFALLKQTRAFPDRLLTDLQLPGVNSLSFLPERTRQSLLQRTDGAPPAGGAVAGPAGAGGMPPKLPMLGSIDEYDPADLQLLIALGLPEYSKPAAAQQALQRPAEVTAALPQRLVAAAATLASSALGRVAPDLVAYLATQPEDPAVSYAASLTAESFRGGGRGKSAAPSKAAGRTSFQGLRTLRTIVRLLAVVLCCVLLTERSARLPGFAVAALLLADLLLAPMAAARANHTAAVSAWARHAVAETA